MCFNIYVHIYIYILKNIVIQSKEFNMKESRQVGRVFTNYLGSLRLILGCVLPKTLRMVLNISLLNTQQYKVHIESKVEQSRERSSALPYTSV